MKERFTGLCGAVQFCMYHICAIVELMDLPNLVKFPLLGCGLASQKSQL